MFYGTNNGGGGASNCGTVFKLDLRGNLTTLHSFSGTDGCNPVAGLTLGTDGNFYGTTYVGTVFQITPGGTLSTLYAWSSWSQGYGPKAKLTQGTDGNFYGSTTGGGASNDGTIFQVAMGLGQSVRIVPAAGRVGRAVKILGNNLTGATNVSFYPIPATFTVVRPTEITATVPEGALTGTVEVTLPSGIVLSSNVAFQVLPSITGFSPTSGTVRTQVTITGERFTGATRVTFGGVKAKFTVDSYTQITATVPTGAVTGNIAVTTPDGSAISSTPFTVN
jgi:uncharacterized repeat protein (TIGR03803 family)